MVLILHSCQSQNRTGCLADDKALYQLEEDFKKELKLYYDLEGEPQGEHYRDYLKQALNYAHPRRFFTHKKKVEKMKIFKESDSFKLLWNKLSVIKKQTALEDDIFDEDITVVTEDGIVREKEKVDFYTIDPYSHVFNCLIERMADTEAKNMFKTIQEVGGLPYPLIGEALMQLDQFNDPSIQTYISLQFYYDRILIINDISTIK